MSFHETKIFREKVEGFLANAGELFSKENNDLAAFNIEQYFQLIIKNIIY
ncbi:MAG: hypothetical protein H5T50_07595 [Nitrososphaeria archaeon]|nr:hypothetical protein [Nitrososphaeria archaeon]